MRNITDEEFIIASRYLFLSMAVEVIQKDLDTLRNNNIFKISEPYIHFLEAVEKKAIEERRKLKQRMYQNKLSVLLTDKSDQFTEYTYYAKRKEEKRNYFNPAIRKKVLLIIEELFESIKMKVGS
ncbi:hypothetical protein SAMN04487943_106272 [Gracilibacillus orientalis]|uniref:Uncharacterized protein n=1 Tax=Gracilibacillus orientalis TaxID=334253 RepID=A0A1I4MI92_9BACI|nr:hypothetical protein [Gracilibacillus orientalis]SFM02780.1 hypothetical protein SAMN04487943_106272 [Gracilibacillus orientalis]